MALQVGELYAKLGLNDSEFNQKMGGAEGKFRGFGANLIGIATGFVATVGTLMGGMVAKVGIEANATAEQSLVAWETLLGSAEEAVSTVKNLEEMGKATPFEFEGLDKSAKLLQMTGFEGEELFETLTSVGDAVSAVGGGQEELQGVAMALFQMGAKGKVSAEEMNQMAERGIGVWGILSEQTGKSTQELMKMGEEGKLLADEMIPLLVDGMGKKFAGSMQKQSQTFNGLMSTMRDNAKLLAKTMTAGLFDKIKSVLPTINALMEDLNAKFQAGGWSEVFKSILPPSVVAGIQSGGGMITSIISGIKNFMMGYYNYVVGVWNGGLGQAIGSIFNTFRDIALPILQDAIAFVKSIMGQLVTFWNENGAQIGQAVTNIWNGIANVFRFIAPVISFIVQSLWSNVKGIIQGALNIIMGLVKIFVGIFTGDFSKMWEGIKQLFMGAVQFIWNLISLMFVGKILSGIKAMGTGMVTNIRVMWANGKDIFVRAVASIKSIIANFKTSIANYITGMKDQALRSWVFIKDGARNQFTAMVTLVRSIISNLVASVRSGLNSAVSTARNAFTNFASAVRSGANRALENVKSAIRNIKSTIMGLARSAWGWGRDVMMGFANGIGNALGSVVAKAKSVAKGVKNAVTGFFGIRSPSRLMMWAGGHVSGGLAKGITKGGKGVLASARKVAQMAQPKVDMNDSVKGIQSKIRSTMAGSGAGGSMITVVSPVIVNGRQIAKATSTHNSRQLYKTKDRALRSHGTKGGTIRV